MKKIVKYIVIFLITLLICIGLLVLTSKIPKSSIDNNIKESVEYYKGVRGIEKIKRWREYSWIHYYADSILLNIIYSIDTDKPLESSLKAMYYESIKQDVNDDFITLVEENKEANTEYIRYWHGSMVIVRTLLVLFNIEQIYIINAIILSLLAIYLIILLFKKHKPLAISFLLGLISVMIFYVPKCLEYTWTIYIMLIVSILSIYFEKKKEKLLLPMFFITGMLTCYFDFLSTEILTVLVPLLIILCIRYKEKRIKYFKKTFKFVFSVFAMWGLGYVLMWFSKWILASIVLNINAFDYVTDKAMVRIGQKVNRLSGIDLSLAAIIRNIKILFPISNFKKYEEVILLAIPITLFVVHVLIIDIKKSKKLWFSLILLFIGITPYIRYAILANHSYRHAFFTFRDQLVTVMVLVLIIANVFVAKRDSLEITYRGKELWKKN